MAEGSPTYYTTCDNDFSALIQLLHADKIQPISLYLESFFCIFYFFVYNLYKNLYNRYKNIYIFFGQIILEP